MLVFFGSNNFAKIFLENFSKKIKPDLVVSKPDSRKGRKKIISQTPVKALAKKLNLEIFTPTNLKEKSVVNKLKKYKDGIFLIAEYGKIIPKEILSIPKKKTINIHPSLLPKFRGPTPIQTALLKKENKTGITIHLTEESIDTGNILIKKEINILPEDNYLSLEKKLAKLSAKTFLKIFDKWNKGEIKPVPQNNLLASYTRKFNFQDGKISPCQEDISTIEAKIKALNPEPGTYLKVKKGNKEIILKIFEIEKLTKNNQKCNTFSKANKQLALKCKDYSFLIKKLQIEGKKIMDSKSFLAGNQWILKSKTI